MPQLFFVLILVVNVGSDRAVSTVRVGAYDSLSQCSQQGQNAVKQLEPDGYHMMNFGNYACIPVSHL